MEVQPRTPERTKRRGKGEGSIYFDASRQQWVAEVAQGSTPGGRRRALKIRGRTKAEVLDKLDELKARAKSPSEPPEGEEGDITTAAWLDSWITNLAPGRRSANTISNYRWAFEKWVIPKVGEIPLGRLGPADLERVWQAMGKEGLSAGSIKAAKAAVSAAISDARKRGLVDRHAAQLSEIPYSAPKESPKRRMSKRGVKSLTVEEVDKLALFLREKEHPYEAMILMGVRRGLRPGELTGLTWEDVDFKAGTVRIHRARIEEGGEARHGKPKTKSSERLLQMPPEVIEALRRRQVQWEAERERAGEEWEDLDLVFCTRTGGFLKRRNLERRFERIGDEVGIEGLTPYILRHTAASLLAAEGIPREGLAELLGHTTTRMVDGHYVHRVVPVIDVEKWRPSGGGSNGGRSKREGV